MKVRKWYKLNKNSEKPFSSNSCSGHTECLFMELSGNLLLKLRTVHNQNRETKEDKYSFPGKISEKNQDTKNSVSKSLIAKFPSKVQRLFVQCQNVMEKKCAKNKSTKRLVGSYNNILTKLSDFFSTKIQTYSLNDCFEVKTTSSFFKKVILPAKSSAGQVKCIFDNPIELIAKPSNEFSIKVRKREKLKTKCSKKHFPQVVVCPDTKSAILRNFQKFSDKSTNSFWTKYKK